MVFYGIQFLQVMLLCKYGTKYTCNFFIELPPGGVARPLPGCTGKHCLSLIAYCTLPGGEITRSIPNPNISWRKCAGKKTLTQRTAKVGSWKSYAKKLVLEEPPALEAFDGDFSQIPTTIQKLSKLPLHKFGVAARIKSS